MPLDPRVSRFLHMLNAGGRSAGEPTVDERRLGLAELMQFAGPAPSMILVEATLPGPPPIPVRIYTPPRAAGITPGLIYFHGGGFVAGTLATHDGIARALAEVGQCRVVSVGYRLAPEHRFPAAIDDALAAVTYLMAHAEHYGMDTARLGLCGDSAGATLATATCQSLARVAPSRIALQLLLCPILDYSQMTDSRHEFASGYLVDQATLEHDLRYYLPIGTDAADPRVSPLRASDLSGMPPTIIHTAEYDPLRDEGRQYSQRLAEAGSAVSYTCHPGMIHLFYGLGGVIPYARDAFQKMGGEIRAALS